MKNIGNLAICLVIAIIGAALHDSLPAPWNYSAAFLAGAIFGMMRDTYYSSQK